MENNNISGNPWKGLLSYTYQDADRFYGRDQELKDIASVIKQNAFTTLYGISGAGKTSIINAGLFPILDKQSFLPIYIRLDHNVGHISYDMQIIKAVDSALAEIEAESEQIVSHKVESELDKLWLYFHSHKFWSKDNHIVNPIIFIDQFEEIFTKNEDTEDIWSFFNIIDSLQYSTPTERIIKTMESADQFVSFSEEQNFRMVFSMREDFLARLEDYSYNIPALRKNRIGLKPLNGLQALEVILKPRPDMVNRKVALHIISKVVGKTITDNERKLEATSVDTSILSLFCTELYNYALNDNKGAITIPLVDLYGGNILEWFYDRNMQILPKQTYVYLENQLLTHSGFRNSVALENLLENGVFQEQLDLLAENRIVRIEDVNHNLRVEFTHDVLCKIAKKRKDERDKIEKVKGEKSARQAFTIDTIILFSTFTLGLLAYYYVGFDDKFIVTILSLPFVAFLTMTIFHRTVADKNLSNTIWFIIISLVIELGLGAGLRFVNLKTAMTEEVFNTILISFLSLPPLAIILMPFAIFSKLTLHDKFPFFKNMRRFTLLYLVFLSFQSILLGLWSFYFVQGHNENYYMVYLPYFLIPSILLATSPVYYLYQDIKKKESKLLSGYSMAYTIYLLLSIVMIWIESEHHIFPSSDSDANLVSIAIIWGVIGILCVFYALQYMKLPKQQNFTEYYKNVLSFQSFTKYKSLKYRLHTILICFTIFMMGVLSTLYIDIIPFITLPATTLLCLYAASKEFKMTTAKKAFSLKTVLPILFLSEVIIGCQYSIGVLKTVSIYVVALLLTILLFGYLVHKETIRSRKLFALRILVFSTFVGFLLPMICLGYNVFNPSLTSVCRVWNGTISSNFRNINFMTIQNELGDLGVMDYSEIIIEPQCEEIASTCSINSIIMKSVYPFRNLLMTDVFKLRKQIGSEYSYYKSTSDEINAERILSFQGTTHDGYIKNYNGNFFLEFENKYGVAYVDACQSNYTKIQSPSIFLSQQNKCLSEKDRKTAIIKLFIQILSTYVPNASSMTFYGEGNNTIEIWSTDNDTVRVLKTCYNEVALDSLLKNSNMFTLDQIYQTSLNSSYLFTCDNSDHLEKTVLENLWEKLKPDSTETVTHEDKAFLYLLLGKKDYAERLALSFISKTPNSANALLNLCLSLYCNGKKSQMETELQKFKQQHSDALTSNSFFDKNLSGKISHLKENKIIHDHDEDSLLSTFCLWGFTDILQYKKSQLIDLKNEDFIESRADKRYTVNFTIDKRVTIIVVGDNNTSDLDVIVYDETGDEVCSDFSSNKDCLCSFLPIIDREYTIKIINQDYQKNYYQIRITQDRLED